jgi:hypothetical protein
MLHIEELFKRVKQFEQEVRRAVDEGRFNQIEYARVEFIAFCEENGLPIDFTERS